MESENIKLTQTLADIEVSTDTVFCRSLVTTGMLTEVQMRHAAERYMLGRTDDGGVVFWVIDERQQVRDGKIMFYRDDCHRDHDHTPDWMINRLKRSYGYNGDIGIERCLFGLHLLRPATIAVVEAEKTAVICSELFPQFLWMASGGQTMLNVARLYPLREHKVVLFPDTDPKGKTYTDWLEKAEAAQSEFRHPIRVSRILEERATSEQKQRKIDIVDFLFETITTY